LLRKNTKDKETFKEIFFSNIYNTELPFEPKKIIDAGSNIGLASFFFRIKYPKSKIVAFEIETENYNTSIKNLKGINEIEVFKKAIFNKKTNLKIEDPYNASNSFVIKEVAEGDNFEIESITIDEILKEQNWNSIDLLKIDIEGAEKNLFESNYENWLPKTKMIMIETHDRMIENCSYIVMKTLNENNFLLYTTTNGGTLVFYNKKFINL